MVVSRREEVVVTRRGGGGQLAARCLPHLQLLCLRVEYRHQDAYQLYEGDDKGSEEDRPQMVPEDAAEGAGERYARLPLLVAPEEVPVGHIAGEGRPSDVLERLEEPKDAKEKVDVDRRPHPLLVLSGNVDGREVERERDVEAVSVRGGGGDERLRAAYKVGELEVRGADERETREKVDEDRDLERDDDKGKEEHRPAILDDDSRLLDEASGGVDLKSKRAGDSKGEKQERWVTGAVGDIKGGGHEGLRWG